MPTIGKLSDPLHAAQNLTITKESGETPDVNEFSLERVKSEGRFACTSGLRQPQSSSIRWISLIGSFPPSVLRAHLHSAR